MDMKILVVDDDVISREMVGASLKRLGYMADMAKGVQEAFESAETDEYSVIITDKNMPDSQGGDEGGMELLAHAKKNMPFTEVIIMTAYASIESSIEAMKLGAFDYMTKPLDNLELRGKLERIKIYKGFINPGNTIKIYKTLHNEILKLFELKEQCTDEKLHESLKAIDKNIDHFFRAQKEWERIFLTQKDALGEIAVRAEQLMEKFDKSDPRFELVEKICEYAAKRI